MDDATTDETWLTSSEAAAWFKKHGIAGLSRSTLNDAKNGTGSQGWWQPEYHRKVPRGDFVGGGGLTIDQYNVTAIAAAVAEWTGDEGAVTASAGGSLREALIVAQTRRTEAQATQEEIRAKAALQDYVAIADLQSLFAEMQTILRAAHGRLSRLPNDGVEAHRILDEALQQCEQLTEHV